MEEKIQDKKTAVLQAALELISEQGFHGAPMSQIAQRANVSIGTIYRSFSSKEDLINALYIDVKTHLAQFALRNYSESLPVHKCFSLLLRNIIDYFVNHPMEFLFMEQYSNSPLITDASRQEGLRMFEHVSNLFKRATEENLLKVLPVEMINTLAYGGIMSLVKFYLFSEVKPDDAILNGGVDAIWDAIKG